MSFKLVIFSALIAFVSSAHFDVNHRNRQFEIQNDMIREQNEKIREQNQQDNYHRNEQLRQLEEQRRVLEQINRNQYKNFFHQAHYPTTRNFNNFDNSNYGFNYAVADRFTGDMKAHQENRFGENVEGRYMVIDADGMERIVNYRDNGDGMQTEVIRQYPGFQNIRQYNNNQYRFDRFQPTIFASTSVSKNDDGQRSDYVTATTSNF